MSDQQKVLLSAVGLFVLGAFLGATGHRGSTLVMGIGVVCMLMGALCAVVWLLGLIFGWWKNKEWPEH